MSNLEILDNKSPLSFYKTIASAFFENWPLECKDYYECDTVEEIEHKIVEEYRNVANNECPFTILYVDKNINSVVGSVSVCKTDIVGSKYSPWISDLWVNKNYRNCGISKALLDNILYCANKKMGINKIYLWVDIKNDYVVKLYEKYGFTILEKTVYCDRDIYIMLKTTWDSINRDSIINLDNEGLIYNQLLVNELNKN
jgi:ribosomal protein S18 acetylase RimI-like enzyme